MRATQTNQTEARPARDGWRTLWGGLLPEVFGLTFVGIVAVGFGVAYWLADWGWQQDQQAERQRSLESVALGVAQALGSYGDADDAALWAAAEGLGQSASLTAIRWVQPNGKPRLVWPRAVSALGPGAPGGVHDGMQAAAPVVTLDGVPAGQVTVTRQPPHGAGYRTALMMSWVAAVLVSLTAYGLFYWRLRRRLQPAGAIQRTLSSYAEGVEGELSTLHLSDSLGSVARGWNTLIDQLNDLQQQLQTARDAGQTDVLTRFEGSRFRRVVDRLPFGVLCMGDETRITYANPSASAMLRIDPDETVGTMLSAAVQDTTVTQAAGAIRLRPGATLTVDHTRSEGENETTFRFRFMAITPEPGSDSLVTIEDISQLREGQRARDNFLYHVTHELRTPLTNIHAYAETLTKPGFDDEQTRKECYNVLISETQRLSRLVEDILSISQMEVGTVRLNMGNVDLARLIRQMVQDNLGAADEKRIDLTLAMPPKMPKIEGDKQRLSVLLSNLIGNAIKYTPENGKVHVAVEAHESYVSIAVEDTGIGISPEDQAHVFDKFYRAADDKVQEITGTGLGLALAREVARLHGGDIQLESEVGRGSRFTIELPTAADHAEVGAT